MAFSEMVGGIVAQQTKVSNLMKDITGAADNPAAQLDYSFQLMQANQVFSTMTKSMTQYLKATYDAQQAAIDKSH